MEVKIGRFIGAVIGEALKICGPTLEDIIYRALKRLFTDSAELGKPVDALQSDWLRNQVSNPKAGNGGSADGGRQG